MPDIVYDPDGTGVANRNIICHCCNKLIAAGDRVTYTLGSNSRWVHVLCRPVFWYDDGHNRFLLPTNTAYSKFNSEQHTAASWHSDWKGGIPPTHIWNSQSVVIEEAISKLQRKWKAWKKRWKEEVDGKVVALMMLQSGAIYKWQLKYIMYVLTKNIICY